MFGFPTGLRALLVRNEAAEVLRKTYFGGGTAEAYLVAEDYFVPKPNVVSRFEDGGQNGQSLQHSYPHRLFQQHGSLPTLSGYQQPKPEDEFACMEAVTVPLETNLTNSDLRTSQSKVCGDRVQTEDCGEEVSAWLSVFLEKPCRLIRQRPEFLHDMKFGRAKGDFWCLLGSPVSKEHRCSRLIRRGLCYSTNIRIY
ncbi:hypothetical protein cypCar_00022129 [Cyprinus carpio]|nr:hypothetical protein cypCar_00022129 [Cyprinus carpio]